jgi:Domain of unknown function (DUF4286)
MIVYSVTVTLQAGAESEWPDWMRRVHVPDVLKTGCFLRCQMYKVLDCDEPTYVLQYHCQAIENYHHYRDQFAPALQKEHSERYAGQFRASRQLLEEMPLT